MLAMRVARRTRSMSGRSSETPMLPAIVSEKTYPSCITVPHARRQHEGLYCAMRRSPSSTSPAVGV